MDLTVEIIGLKGVEDALSQAGPKLAKRALRKALVAGAELFEMRRKRKRRSSPGRAQTGDPANCGTQSI